MNLRRVAWLVLRHCGTSAIRHVVEGYAFFTSSGRNIENFAQARVEGGKRVLRRGFASLCWYENNLSGNINMGGGFAVAAFALLLVAVNQNCICLLQLDETPHVKEKAYGAHVLAEPSF